MPKILALIIVLVYFLIGFIVYGALNGDDEIDSNAAIVMLFWPIILIEMIGFGLFALAYNLGRFIGGLFGRK